MTNTLLCDFGCSSPAIHQFKNGKNCCSNVSSGCPAIKAKNNASKRITLDWVAVQSDYDAGLSSRELAKKYDVSPSVIQGAAKQGRLTMRTKSESVKLSLLQGKGCQLHSDASKKKISDYAKLHHGGYVQGSGRGKKGWYNDQFCDSSWELAYLIYCEAHSIIVARNTEKFQYVFEGKTKNYLPDFIVDGKYVEIKGYLTDEWEAKKSSFPYELEVLTQTEMKPILEYVINLHGKDFIKLYEAK